MRSSGWRETVIGVESGSNNILYQLRKGITAEQTIQAAEILSELDLYAQYSVMFLLPHETRNDRKLTYALIKILKCIHSKSFIVGPQPFRPYPDSDLYRYCLGQGLMEPKTFREWRNFTTEEGQTSGMPWIKEYSLKDRLLEGYLLNLQVNGLKDTCKRIGQLIIKKSIKQKAETPTW